MTIPLWADKRIAAKKPILKPSLVNHFGLIRHALPATDDGCGDEKPESFVQIRGAFSLEVDWYFELYFIDVLCRKFSIRMEC